MRPFILQLNGTEYIARHALGAVVCARVRAPNGKRLFEKGQVIGEADLPALLGAEGSSLSLIMPEEGDLHEDEAAMRLGRAAAGEGIEVAAPWRRGRGWSPSTGACCRSTQPPWSA
jgi:hypothetical protein